MDPQIDIAHFQRRIPDINSSLDCSLEYSFCSNTSKTPMKSCNKLVCVNEKTPCKTPVKTPDNKNLSSSSSSSCSSKSKKSKNNLADRFIPNRTATQFELGYFLHSNSSSERLVRPPENTYTRLMNENLNGASINTTKIIAYRQKSASASKGCQGHIKSFYDENTARNVNQISKRCIPQVPEKILDAPDIIDDYYLNLLDWSPNNCLAVCLGSCVYLWNAETREIKELFEIDAGGYACSVAWLPTADHLSVGTSAAEVQIWDINTNKRIRNMKSHSSRVSSLSPNDHLLSSGSQDGSIHHHDIRVRDHHISTLSHHTHEVCGLSWSPDKKYLASGGNDNVLNIWCGSPLSGTRPLHSLTQHKAAVKALAWCPWQPSLLASGGGTADRTIRFWNANSGSCLKSVDTKSQVCSLLWSSHYKELISSHGFADHQLIIWSYPSMSKVTELTGHSARVLNMALSPDGSTVVSASADETLRLWKCFAMNSTSLKKNKCAQERSAVSSIFRFGIR